MVNTSLEPSLSKIDLIVQTIIHNFYLFAEDPTLDGQNVHDIAVFGNSGYRTSLVSSRLALPMDLTQSSEKVCLIHEDENLSNFQ